MSGTSRWILLPPCAAPLSVSARYAAAIGFNRPITFQHNRGRAARVCVYAPAERLRLFCLRRGAARDPRVEACLPWLFDCASVIKVEK